MFKGGRGAARSEPTVRRALPKTGALVGGLTWTGFPPGSVLVSRGGAPPAGSGRRQRQTLAQEQGRAGSSKSKEPEEEPGLSQARLTGFSPAFRPQSHTAVGVLGSPLLPGKPGSIPAPSQHTGHRAWLVTVTSSRGLRERPECPPLLPVTSVEVSAPLSEGDPLLLRDLGHSLWEKLGSPGDGVSAGGCTGRGQEKDLTSDWRHREGSGSLQRAPPPRPLPTQPQPPPCGFRVLRPQQT